MPPAALHQGGRTETTVLSTRWAENAGPRDVPPGPPMPESRGPWGGPGRRSAHLLSLQLLPFADELDQQPCSLQIVAEFLPVFQLFLHRTCLLVLLPLSKARTRGLWAPPFPQTLLQPPRASAIGAPASRQPRGCRRPFPPAPPRAFAPDFLVLGRFFSTVQEQTEE